MPKSPDQPSQVHEAEEGKPPRVEKNGTGPLPIARGLKTVPGEGIVVTQMHIVWKHAVHPLCLRAYMPGLYKVRIV